MGCVERYGPRHEEKMGWVLGCAQQQTFLEGHGVWIWEERTLVTIFLFLETRNIHFIYSQRVSGLQKYTGKLVAELKN